ncbi:hypothetical protein Terro_0607 [Terriglobus roseus DSM 18391]|uniref:Uncharacterized protein n=1 Tax=Terriglobus roseus (strain DSM 18391 / NRRL B-41598 / KBS 63) TaxID=926566 RepID=I3ZCH8_TERRK|nr:hypothetical protein [Terriglobus roseus]AFL86946.1 hypothetical protein Terro_0607 [Terriglobus roseus DSM 18391]
MRQHHALTDEQFADLLAGRPSAGTLSELHDDADAELELAELKSALHSYRAETLDWAERRAATAPSLVPAARRRALWVAVPQWSMAAIAVAAVAVGVGHFSGRGSDDAMPNAASISAPAVLSSASEIATDNQLLTSIDDALTSDLSAVDALGLKPASDAGRHGNME